MYDKIVIETFLKNQLQLFPEVVASTPEEAEEFLDICMATVCKDYKEVKKYLDTLGVDVFGMTKEEILEQSEVFALPDGRYLIVEG